MTPARTVIDRVVVDALQVPAELSGIGRVVQAIGRELRELPDGLRLELRCTREARPLLEPAFAPETIVRTPLARSRPRWLRILWQQLVAPTRDGRSTLLVCPGDQGPVRGRARVLLVVNDVRRLVRPETSGVGERVFYRLLLPPAARHAAHLVAVSGFSAAELRRAIPGTEPEIVAQRPAAPRTAGRSPDGSVLVVGALRPYKGAETVVEALAQLREDERPLVRFAGSREPAADPVLARAERLGVARSIELLGWVDDERLGRLYDAATATVHPSLYEGYGLGLAESLGCGVPAIASDIPAHREVAAEAAVYFPPGDAAALADALRRVLADADLCERLAAGGSERARQLRAAVPGWREVILAAARPS